MQYIFKVLNKVVLLSGKASDRGWFWIVCWVFVTSDLYAQSPPTLEVPNPLRTAQSIYQNRTIRPDNLNDRYTHMEELLEAGQFKALVVEGMSLYLLDSTQERLLVLLTEAARLEGDKVLFLRMLGNLKQLHPLNGTAWVIEALNAQQQGRSDEEVRALLQQALARESTLSAAWYHLALLEARQSRFKKAIKASDRALRYAADPYDAAMLYGFLQIQKRKPAYVRALSLFELALRSETEGLAGLYAGYCAYMLDRGAYADRLLSEFSLKYPRYPLAYILRASRFASLGDHAGAIHLLQTMLSKAGDSFPYMRQAGLEEVLGNLQSALPDSLQLHKRLRAISEVLLFDDRCLTERLYTDLLRTSSDTCIDRTIVIWSAIGFSGPCTAPALSSIGAAYACDTSSIFLNALLASVYMELNQKDYAYYYLQSAIAYGARYPDMLRSAAVMAHGRKEYATARKYFEWLKPTLSNDPVLWSSYATTLLAFGDTVAAQDLFERSAAAKPMVSEPFEAMARLYASQGHFQAALNMADEAIRRNSDANLYYLRAVLRDTLGFDANVEEDLLASLEMNAEYLPALQKLADYYHSHARMIEYGKALEVLLLAGQSGNLHQYIDHLLDEQDTVKAFHTLSQFIVRYPDDTLAKKVAIVGLVRMRRLQEATVLCEQLLDTTQGEASSLKAALLCCHMMSGQNRRASEMLQKEKNNVDPSFEMARSLYLLLQYGDGLIHQKQWPARLEPQAEVWMLGEMLKSIAGTRGIISQVPLVTIAPWIGF